MYFIRILFAVLVVTGCSNNGNKIDNEKNDNIGDKLKEKITEFQTIGRNFAWEYGNTHGENIVAIETLCGKKPAKIFLSFAAGANKGRFYCPDNTLFADFSYAAALDPAGLILKLADMKFAKKTQEKFNLNVDEYMLAPALEAPSWFFDEKQNEIRALFSFDPKQLKDVKLDFAKGQMTCPDGKVENIAGYCTGVISTRLVFKKI